MFISVLNLNDWLAQRLFAWIVVQIYAIIQIYISMIYANIMREF